MHDEAAKKLIEETFNQPYSHDRFRKFIHETTKSYEDRNTSCQIPDNFKDSIKSVYRIGKFVDAAKNEIDILSVTLAHETSLDRARTLQRNFIARHLSVRQKEAALVAFVSPESSSWRFSLVRRELSIALNRRGKSSVKADFSPVRRFSFLVGAGERTHTVKRQLNKFLTTDDRPTLKTLEEAFNIETVTDEFFKEYRELFNRVNDVVVECLSKNSSLKQHFAEKDIEASDFAKRLLGQIVFLYFLQKKGWLGVPRNGKWGEGSRTFLRDLYDKAEKEGSNFFDKYLRHLFYEALNRDHSDNGHYHSLFDSRIPFLNGGLFEPYHDYDWSKHDIALPNTVFHELGSSLFGDDGRGILDVFDRYNFTVAEDEPLEREVAIDPEMLGKVFENLLEVKDRKAKGTYYTPREIVHYMCQESLIAHLATRFPDIPKADIEDVIRYGDLYLEYDTEILKRQDEDRLTRDYNQCQTPATIRNHAANLDQALATVKVCDPAIGSGAFPVGMMTEIIRARRVMALHMRKTPVAYELKRQTIQDCLYGVDLDPGAIEIAKLRLWLSLVVDEDNFDQIQALPNLDYKIMQGNSLLQTYEGVKLFDDALLQRHDNNVRRKQQLEGEMRDLRDRLMAMLTKSAGLSDPKEKKGLERAIGKKQKEIEALDDSGKATKTTVTLLDGLASASGIADQLRKLHVEFFRTAQAGEKKRLKAEIENLELQLVETSLKELHQNNAAPLIEKIRKLQRANVKPYFLWKLHFSEVFSGDNGGFDIVIANPPYVRHEGIKDQKPALKQEFPDFFKGTADLYTYFYRRGVEVLCPNGHLCFIAPNKFFKAGYGENLRTLATTQVNLLKVLDFGELPVFDAGTDPSILLMNKALPGKQTQFASIKHKEALQDLVTCIAKVGQNVSINDLSPSGWNFGNSRDRELLQKINNSGVPLGTFVEGKFYYGIKTGLNEAFVINAETRAHLIAKDPKCEEIIKPWLNGKEIQKWYGDWGQEYLIHIPSSANKAWPWSGMANTKAYAQFIQKYPSIAAYFEAVDKTVKQRQKEQGVKEPKGIEGRDDQGKFYWELRSCAYDDEFPNKKIVYNETSKELHAFIDEDSLYINKTGFILICDQAEYLLGIMNSRLMDFYFRSTFPAWGDVWNGGRVQFRGDRMGRLPIAEGSSGQRKLISDAVAKITTLKKKDHQAEVSVLERKIDEEVYRLYNLTSNEIAIIESATRDAQKKVR